MKKFLILLLSISMCLCFTACGNGSSEDEVDVDETYSEEEATEPEEPVIDVENGIIVVTDSGDTTVTLDVIDPDTGEYQNYKTFSSENCHMYCRGTDNIYDTMTYFNSDYTAVAAITTMDDGAEHVGWVDENGDFTDVSAQVTHESDFNALTVHERPCFGPDNYFYFFDSSNGRKAVRVPIDNISEDSLEIMNDDMDYGNLNPYPDGSVEDSMYGKYYYDKDMTCTIMHGSFHDWSSATQTTYADKYDMIKIRNWKLDSERDWRTPLDTAVEDYPLLPEIEGRENWDPVFSPDGSQVAFLSQLTTEDGSQPTLFVVSSEGGDPEKIETNYPFVRDTTRLMCWGL